MWYILCVLGGILLGFIISTLIRKPTQLPKNVGTLKVVESDDGPPYLFVELEEDARYLFSERLVSMKVKSIRPDSLN